MSVDLRLTPHGSPSSSRRPSASSASSARAGRRYSTSSASDMPGLEQESVSHFADPLPPPPCTSKVRKGSEERSSVVHTEEDDEKGDGPDGL